MCAIEEYLIVKYDCFKRDDELYNFSFEQMQCELNCGKNILQGILKKLSVRKSLADPFGGYNFKTFVEVVILGMDDLERDGYYERGC